MEQKSLLTPLPETGIEPARTLDHIRHARETEALKVSENSLRNRVGSLSYENGLHTSLVKVPDFAPCYDVGQVSYVDLMAYESIGVSNETIFEFLTHKPDSSEAEPFKTTVGKETITTARYSQGVTLQLDVEGHQPSSSDIKTPVEVTNKIKDRIKTSPAHQAIRDLDEKLQTMEEIIEGVQTDYFDPDTDKLGTLSMLSQGGFISHVARQEAVISDLGVVNILESQNGHSVERFEEPGSITYRRSKNGIITEVVVDKESGEIILGFDSDVDYFYYEQANQSSAESIPFVETVCAKEMFSALDEIGVTFSHKYLDEMMLIGESNRFGSVYTQLSREISKWVDRPERISVSNVFMSPNSESNVEIEGNNERDESAVETKEIINKLLSINTNNMSEPTRVLFTMIQDSLDRKSADKTGLLELPITKSEIHIDGGACFDVASYYVGAAGDGIGLSRIEVGGVKLLKKTHGYHTFMLEQPALLNGVRLPKGSLMQKGEDEGWAVLRWTPL